MSEPSRAPLNEEVLASLVSEAQRLLEEIKQTKAQAEEHLKAAEQSRSKADSEARLAFNAKGACEEHSTAIANLKGAVEANASSIVTNKQKSDELLAAINTGKATIDADTKTVNDRRKEVDQSAQGIIKAAEAGAARLQDIDSSKVSAETASKATAEALNAATQARTSAEAAQKQVENFSANAQQVSTTISEIHKASKLLADDIQTLLQGAQKAEADHKKVWEHLEKSDDISTGHEQRISKHSRDIEDLIKRLEGLLPGATSAGLASSFNLQKMRFEPQQKRWLRTFVWCIVGLVVVAIPSFLSTIGIHWFSPPTGPTWNDTWRSLTMRLPIVLPLVWLAIYAGRNYMLSLRLEEDYAYKEAISTAFEGYKREMEKIVGGDSAGPTPITILCANVLRAIAERPGRIYEGKQQDINLLTETQAAAEQLAELSKKKVAAR